MCITKCVHNRIHFVRVISADMSTNTLFSITVRLALETKPAHQTTRRHDFSLFEHTSAYNSDSGKNISLRSIVCQYRIVDLWTEIVDGLWFCGNRNCSKCHSTCRGGSTEPTGKAQSETIIKQGLKGIYNLGNRFIACDSILVRYTVTAARSWTCAITWYMWQYAFERRLMTPSLVNSVST